MSTPTVDLVVEEIFPNEVIKETQRNWLPRPVLGPKHPGGPATGIGWFAVHLLGNQAYRNGVVQE